MNDERPALLELGLLFSCLHALFWLGAALFGGLVVGLGLGAAASLHPAAWLPAGFVGGLAGVFLALHIGWSLLTLYACYRTHGGSRPWAFGLLALSILGLADAGLLSTPARVLTIIGIAQLLERRAPSMAWRP